MFFAYLIIIKISSTCCVKWGRSNDCSSACGALNLSMIKLKGSWINVVQAGLRLVLMAFLSAAMYQGSPAYAAEKEALVGKTLYADDFKDGEAARERYSEKLGGTYGMDCSVTYEKSGVNLIAPLSNITQIRTKDPKAVMDDGKRPVVYSVREEGLPGTTCIYSAILVRMDESSLDQGYEVVRYFDGSNTILSIARRKGGVDQMLYASKNPADDPDRTENEIPELATYQPNNLLEVRLENMSEGVKISVSYNGLALKTLVDDSPDRITEGSGVGLKFRNNGVNQLIGGRFSDLKVIQLD
jgi:hypothetical protein